MIALSFSATIDETIGGSHHFIIRHPAPRMPNCRPVEVRDFIGIYGAQLVGVQIMGVDAGSFWSQMRSAVGLSDINEGIVKSCIFGVACSLIAVYEGYYATPTAEGVGRATTRTVVTSAVVVLFLDYLLTSAFL